MTHNISILLKLIEIDSIKIISFDIFDTLIVRSAITPKDIFVFLDIYYNEITGKKSNIISTFRIECENKLIAEKGVENVTIDLIYEEIRKKLNLKNNLIKKLKQKEISLEVDLASLNHEMAEIFKKAKIYKKKIILISDMYLSSSNIALILEKFQIEYDSLYVSSDFKMRKDKGDLYDEILKVENVHPSEILHIGDNEESDYKIPLNKGILSFLYCPSYLRTKKDFNNNFRHNTDGISSVLLGYTINEENRLESKENMKFTNLYDFGYYFLGSILFSMMVHILFSKEIQNNYDVLYFSSRNGYLPFKVYELLRKNNNHGIPGKYIYCGSRVLSISNYNGNVLEYLSTIYNNIKQKNTKYTIKDLFKSLDIEEYYNENNNDYNIQNYIINIESLTVELEKRKNDSKSYYNNYFGLNKKVIIFDCGYSGSVSDFIYNLTGKKVDKIYMWETKLNNEIDKKNDTKTYLLFNNFLEIQPFNILFEELFSPIEASCIRFINKNNEIFPLLDNNELFSNEMFQDINNVHNGVFDYINKFCLYFTNYLQYFSIINYQMVFDNAVKILYNENDGSINLLENIIFPDKYHDGDLNNSLINKLITKNRRMPFKGNIFLIHDYLYKHEYKSLTDNNNIKIGIHIHLYYIDLYINFLEKLINFPTPFDLYITITNKVYEKMLYILFSSVIINNLKKTTVLLVENRGRDVGPWLIEMKNIHLNYDIFGHFHSKKNVDIGYGDKWRNYLLDNLLNKNVLINILNLFVNEKDLGIVFPPMYKDVYNGLTSVGDPPFQELELVNKFLFEIELPKINNCNKILFSAGTMFWYRPIALKKLFYEKLTYNDFQEEPIGINGTLAHAIERLPSYVAKEAGYNTKVYLNNNILSKTFYNQYQRHEINDNKLNKTSEKRKLYIKIYYLLIRIIPENKREIIDYNIRKILYPKIKYLRKNIIHQIKKMFRFG
jgi:FMN phosphatase YigB (HAD superfamily)